MNQPLNFLLTDIQQACEMLASEKPGTLTERQRARVDEIRACSLDLANTIIRYEMLCAVPEMNKDDPRDWLMYAARTPLAMIEMSIRLLMTAHLRQGEPLTKQQHQYVQAMETAGQKLAYTTQLMWAELETDY